MSRLLRCRTNQVTICPESGRLRWLMLLCLFFFSNFTPKKLDFDSHQSFLSEQGIQLVWKMPCQLKMVIVHVWTEKVVQLSLYCDTGAHAKVASASKEPESPGSCCRLPHASKTLIHEKVVSTAFSSSSPCLIFILLIARVSTWAKLVRGTQGLEVILLNVQQMLFHCWKIQGLRVCNNTSTIEDRS